MRLATFSASGKRQVGLMAADGAAIEPLQLDPGSDAATAIRHLVTGRKLEASGPPVPLDKVTFEAPIPRPAGTSSASARTTTSTRTSSPASGFDATAEPGRCPTRPIVFSKVPECVIAPAEPILIHPRRQSTAIDYEGELAVVIGKGGRGIAKADALDHVWGYTIVNDVTARDLQGRHKQWLIGKSQDSFCPMGPAAVTRDEVDLADTAACAAGSTASCARTPVDRRPDLRHADPDRDASRPASRCSPATSSPPARRPVSASASPRRNS